LAESSGATATDVILERFAARELNQIRQVIELNLLRIEGAWHEHCN
jgi:hypothetical protein